MSVGNGIGWASLNAVAAENAARIVDVVDARVTFTCGNSPRIGVFRRLDVYATSRAGRRAQEAANTLFQSVFIAVENVDTAVSWLEMDRFFGVIFGDGFPQHIAEGHAKAFYKRDKRFASFFDDGRHRKSV